jgi:membrane fusion protein (multidrug efflux system)
MRVILGLIVVAMLGGAGYWLWRDAFEPPISTVAAHRGAAAEVVYATGTVEPRYWAKVVATQRKRIVELCDCEGQPVRKGQVLARLDDATERAALAELEARHQRLELDVLRIRGLVERNAATQTSLDQTITQTQEYAARIEAQKERIDDLVLRAPMDGTVLRRDGAVGELAGTGNADVLFWIGQQRPLRVVADVNEEDIPRVRTGQKVLLRSEGFTGETLPATVAEVTPKGDPVSKAFRTYLALPKDTPLRIGMSVEANIVTRERADALLVPGDAILDGAVFVVSEGRLKRVPVTTGIRGSRLVEVTDGLSDGAVVASPAKPAFRDGQRVRSAAGATP